MAKVKERTKRVAKKKVKRAAKTQVKKKTGKKGGKKSPERAPSPERALAEEPPFEPDAFMRREMLVADKDRYDDHRGHWVIPNQPIYEMVRTSGPLSGVFAFAMREFERQARWMRAMSQGILIMFRMPGGFTFDDEELPDDLGDRLQTYDRPLLFSVLERCLTLIVAESKSTPRRRLRSADKAVVRDIMTEVTGDPSYRPQRMSIALQRMLARLETNQLLNAVAECFDLLVMVPILQQQTAALSADDRRRGAGE